LSNEHRQTLESSLLGGHPNIAAARDRTAAKLTELRKALNTALDFRNVCVVASGSVGRGEVTQGSDLDYFILCQEDNLAAVESNCDQIAERVASVMSRAPAEGGAFAQPETIESMEQKIGGQDDPNNKLTRRLLFLLEGVSLYGDSDFHRYRRRVLEKYVRETITDHQLLRFLLNDIIRYYRTICVDFEYKTAEQGKPWGTRNIKLIFSRKLLYFSGLLVVAETVQHSRATKISTAEQLLDLTPLQRLVSLCGPGANRALGYYDHFLKALQDQSVREKLDKVTDDRDTQVDDFRELKNRGHHFSYELYRLFRTTYPESHPIHLATIL